MVGMGEIKWKSNKFYFFKVKDKFLCKTKPLFIR